MARRLSSAVPSRKISAKPSYKSKSSLQTVQGIKVKKGVNAGTNFIIGHRGAARHAPENTLASLKKAAALGASWVEFDAKLTADGVVILMHDDTLDRTSTGKGPVAHQTADQLARLDAGSWFGKNFKGEKIPTLEAVIDCLKSLDLGANVEIKPCPGREEETGCAVADTLMKQWPTSLPPPLLSSFKAQALMGAKAVAPGLERAYLLDRHGGEWEETCHQLGCKGLHLWHGLVTSPSFVTKVHAAGMAARVYTVNSLARARLLLDWDIDGIVTDDLLALAPLL
ncbi:MAG: glycerophosphodiester phosphodiesterase [Alphaproteobacteria bacterium]